MRYLNLVREVQTAAGLSKSKLASRLGKSQNLVAAWELDPKPDEARQLAQIAREVGRDDLEAALLVMAGDEPEGGESSLENLRGDEHKLAEWIVSLYRSPQNDLEKAAVQIVLALRKMRSDADANQLAPAFAALSPENQHLLESFIRKPEAMMIVAAIVSGGNPPSAFAKPEGEDMAKRKSS